MESNTFRLVILTPYGKYFDNEVEFLNVKSEKYNLGILPKHAPLISTLVVSEMEIRMFNNTSFHYAIGGGAIEISKKKVTLILDSIEKSDEIDVDRANQAKERAQNRLANKNDPTIDMNRAKLAYTRAVNRLNIALKNRN